jgi:hypothetical protein
VALERQIHDLRVRQAVLRYAAARGTDADGLVRAGRLARLTGEQRRALVTGLVAEVINGAPVRTDSVPAARWFLTALESSGRRGLPVTPTAGG